MPRGVIREQPPVNARERATWALERLLEACDQLERSPDDRVRVLAVLARRREHAAAERVAGRADARATAAELGRKRGRPRKFALVP
jgi:hypothetical protein